MPLSSLVRGLPGAAKGRGSWGKVRPGWTPARPIRADGSRIRGGLLIVLERFIETHVHGRNPRRDVLAHAIGGAGGWSYPPAEQQYNDEAAAQAPKAIAGTG